MSKSVCMGFICFEQVNSNKLCCLIAWDPYFKSLVSKKGNKTNWKHGINNIYLL